MSFNQGQSPQKILEGIKLEEAQRAKGRLKIYLGMAPGVGKTYAMLEEALILRKDQIDVVVGNVEAHGRKEIEALLQNLPQIPEKILLYQDKEFRELDIESIITLKPNIVLVDELAHSNVPGSKNKKRWQDVQEILEHGINVHTTLNVQHIESLNDIILGITDIAVREIVPDAIIENAHSIQLIDLTPEELLQRLKEGKVYTNGHLKIPSLDFFQKNTLAALREVVLRYVADKVDVDLMCMVTTKEGRVEWKPHEKFLVAISLNPQSPKLIKATHRLAMQANAPWLVVYVNTGNSPHKEAIEQLEKSIELAHALGAETITINDPDVAEGIKRVAYQRDITQIIIGRPLESLLLSIFQGPTLLDKLAADCKNIDLHVIRLDKYTAAEQRTKTSHVWQSKFSDYLFASLVVCLFASLSWVALSLVGHKVVEFLFFIGICATSVFFKRGPVTLAAILFGLIWHFLFTPPPPIASVDDTILLILYVLTAIFFGIFVERIKVQNELFRKDSKKN